MGIFRDLVSNVANARMREEQQKLQYNQGLGDILTSLIANPNTDPATLSKASGYYVDLLGKHGGREGRALQNQISQFLTGYVQKRAHDRAMAQMGEEPQDQVQPTPPGGTQPQDPNALVPGAIGMRFGQAGAPGPATPASLAPQAAAAAGAPGAGAPAAAAPAQRGGGPFRPVLRTLAGVGGEMIGIPRGQQQLPISPAQAQALFAPTPVEQAQEKERGALAAQSMEQQQYFRQQDEMVRQGLQSQEQANENKTDYVREMRAPGARAATAEAQKQTTVELRDGTVIPAWESTRKQTFETLDHKPIPAEQIRAVGTPVEPKITGRLAERKAINDILAHPEQHTPEEVQAAKEDKAYMDAQTASAASEAQIRGRQAQSSKDIVAGTSDFKIAQDLAYGRLTFSQFRGMFGYRDSEQKEAIYAKAGELNPNFNAAEFEAGYRFAVTPRTRQQLAALDNVEAGVTDLLRLSDAAQRSGMTVLNQYISKGGYAIGGRNYTNFAAARTAFADELSGALGFGGATDMSRRMGFDMTDPNLSPENFRSAILDVVQPFLDRKRDSLISEMGPYGEAERQRQRQRTTTPPPQNRTTPPAAPSKTGDDWLKKHGLQ